jgi:anti-sigma regulatory factor (Ser/Thr protein kinase)
VSRRPADPRSLSGIRTAVRDWLAPLHGLSHDDWDDVLLAMSEAAREQLHRTRLPRPGARGRGISLMKQIVGSVVIHHDSRGTAVLSMKTGAGDKGSV